jgi:hypothetical protein
MDVGVSFVLAILAFAIMALTQGKLDKQTESETYRAYRILLHGILATLAVFFVLGDRIIWINCITGFAWRVWLFLYALPAWLTALRAKAHPHDVWSTRPFSGTPDNEVNAPECNPDQVARSGSTGCCTTSASDKSRANGPRVVASITDMNGKPDRAGADRRQPR